MYSGHVDQILGQIAWGIEATAVVHTVADKRQVVLLIYIKRWYGPVAYRLLRLLLHLKHFHLVVNSNDARALQAFQFGLMVAHDDRALLLVEEIDKASK